MGGRPRRCRTSVTRVAGAGALALALLISACGSDDPGKEVRGKTPLAAGDPASIPFAVGAVNAFGTDLYRAYGEQNRGNFVLSPYAVAYALGMTRAGAAGDTLQQIDRVLHTNATSDLNRGFATLAQVMATRNGDRRSDTRKGKVDIIAASSAWAPRGTKFKDSYLDTLSTYFGTGVRVVDFRSDPDAGRSAINNWGHDATHGAVTQLLRRGELTDQTSLVDASTLTVQAPWAQPFPQEQTTPATFDTGTSQTTPRTMAATVKTGAKAATGDGWTAVELPYLGNQLSLVLVLPAAGTFDAFEKSFDGEKLRRITDALRPQPVDVRVPKFQFETDARLDGELQAMGMPAAFNDHDADFSGIADNESLAISAAVHQSYIDVSENGSGTQTGSIAVTPAAAPTDPQVERVSFDRPFLVLVRDEETGLVLSLGRVSAPNG